MGYIAGGNHPCKNNAVCQLQMLYQLCQRCVFGTVPHHQKHRIRQIRHDRDKRRYVLFFGKPAQIQQNLFVIGQVQPAPQGIITRHSKAGQLQPSGKNLHRALHAISQKQAAYFGRGGNYGIATVADAAGKKRRQPASHAAAGGKIMGVILIHGVVGVDQRRSGCPCQIPGRGEGAEFTLRMNNVR